MKKSIKTISILLCGAICLPLVAAFGVPKGTFDVNYSLGQGAAKYSASTEYFIPDKPSYLFPSEGTVLERVNSEYETYDEAIAQTDYARYDPAFSITDLGNGLTSIPEQRENSPLKGKMIYWLGSSETYGPWTAQGAPDYLAALTGSYFKKNAYSETTMIMDRARPAPTTYAWQDPDLGTPGSRNGRRLGEFSFIDRLNPDFFGSTAYNDYDNFVRPSFAKFDKNEHVDAFVCAISTNDCSLSYCGNGTEDFWGSIKPYVYDKEAFDVTTTIGAMEYIVAYVWETWHCPIFFYSGQYFGDLESGSYNNNKPHPWEANPNKLVENPKGSMYATAITWAKMVAEKWKAKDVPVHIIDMFNDAEFTAMGDTVYTAKKYDGSGTEQVTYYQWAMYDFVHAKNAAYKQWVAPYFEWALTNALFAK